MTSSVQSRASLPERGVSLIELMVAMTLGLLIVAFLLALYVNIMRTNNEMTRMNRMIENGRFAIQVLQEDASHAGFWGDYIPQFEDRTIGAPGDVPNAVPDPCAPVAGWTGIHRSNLIGIPVQDGVGTCSTVTSQAAGTDILVVRHAAQTPDASSSSCPASDVCFQASRCTDELSATPPLRFVLATTGFTLRSKDCGASIAPIRRYVSSIYYVRDDFTLMRSDFVNGAYQAAQALVDGVQALRVEYGIDNVGRNGNPVGYVGSINRGDGAPDDYVSCSPCTAEQLTNVVTLKIHLLMRAEDPTPGYTDTKTYTLGNTPAIPPFNDAFKRHVLTTTVRLVNPAGRRETP